MTFVRSTRRVAIVGASLTALLVAAACGGGGGGGAAPAASGAAVDLTKTGCLSSIWQGKDTSRGPRRTWPRVQRRRTPRETVTLQELPDNADQQRQQMIQNTQIKNAKMAVDQRGRGLDRRSSRANGYVVPLPADQFPTDRFLKPTVDSATYFNKLYAYPTTSDGGMLYYRKDLLDKYQLEPPTTWDEMKAACEKIKAGENDDKLDCYAGQYQKYEGLTVNFAEAVDSAGGVDHRTPTASRRQHAGGHRGPELPGRTASRTAHPEGRHHLARGAGPAGVPERHADLPPELAGIRYALAQQGRRFVQDRGQVRRRPAAGSRRPGRLQPGRSQLRHRHQRREQGHGGQVAQVHASVEEHEGQPAWPVRRAPTRSRCTPIRS